MFKFVKRTYQAQIKLIKPRSLNLGINLGEIHLKAVNLINALHA